MAEAKAEPRRSSGRLYGSRLIAVLVAGLALECAVVYNAAALSLSRVIPVEQRRTLNASDARSTAKMAEQMLARKNGRGALALARQALARDATLAPAARTAGFALALMGDEKRGNRALGYALKLSRRDLPTLLWYIETRVQAGDVPGALRGYDTALRASRSSGRVLVPILVTAASDKPLSAAMVSYLAANRPPWTQPYLDGLIRTGRDWHAVADIFGGLARRRIFVQPAAADQAVKIVVNSGDIAAGMALYRLQHPSAATRLIRNGDFASDLGATPFDWEFPEGASRYAQISGGALSVEVGADGDGVIARQLLTLGPGQFRLTARLTGDDVVGASLPYWTVTCVGAAGGTANRLTATAGQAGMAAWAAPFTVPAGCTAQWLSLSAPPVGSAVNYKLDDVAIASLAGPRPAASGR